LLEDPAAGNKRSIKMPILNGMYTGKVGGTNCGTNLLGPIRHILYQRYLTDEPAR
jgi:hypothetical protein